MSHMLECPVTTKMAATVASRCLGVAATAVRVARVAESGSTWVFRVRYQGAVFYLRVLPEAGASFAPEVAAHRELRRRGAYVPDVVAFADVDVTVQRSVMLTTAIMGAPVTAVPVDADTHAVFVAAGRDLARINGVPVAGFGWVRRDHANDDQITAAWPTQRGFALEHWEADLAFLAESGLRADEVAALRHLVAHYTAWLDADHAVLAHGDFDTTHIFQHDGHYRGIIDFGEIRGADCWYDLGHFALHDGERLPYAALPDLLRGYGEVTPLPPDAASRIRFAAVLIAVRALARSLQRRPAHRYTGYLWRMLRASVASL